jgi:hypothetical protein
VSALDWWGDLGHKLVFWAVVACGSVTLALVRTGVIA